MGELGTVTRYSYWSDRRVRDIAADNGIDLDRRWRAVLRTPLLGLLPQAELAQERGAVQRYEMSEKVERAIGQLAVGDFVTPPPTAFAKGCGEVTIAVYERWSGPKEEQEEGRNSPHQDHVRQRIAQAEWFAEVYKDIELDKDRWTFFRDFKLATDIPQPVDRIVVGAPLWVRTNSR